MKELNQDIEARDKLIYGKYRRNKYKFDNICYFKGMSVKTLKQLIDQNFANPNCCKSNAPSIQDIYNFMSEYPEYTAHGFTVGIDDEDYGVYIEGVEKGIPSASVEEFKSYMSLFSDSNSFNDTTMYCWFE